MSLPVEVLQFAADDRAHYLESLGATVTLRGGDATPFVTDEGNWIYDCDFGPIADCERSLPASTSAPPSSNTASSSPSPTDLLMATPTGVDHQAKR